MVPTMLWLSVYNILHFLWDCVPLFMCFPSPLCLRSTQMKATSFTAKQHGSTSASPWWTSSRNASGYQKECLKRRWRKRVKTRVSLPAPAPPSLTTTVPLLHPVTVLKHNSGVQLSTIRPSSVLCSLFFWIDSLHLGSDRPHAEPETASPAEDGSSPTCTPILPSSSSALSFNREALPPTESQQKNWRPDTMFWSIPIQRKAVSFTAGWSSSSKAVERNRQLSHRLSSCEEKEHLIAHSWACISISENRHLVGKIKTLVVVSMGCLELCGYRKCYYF